MVEMIEGEAAKPPRMASPPVPPDTDSLFAHTQSEWQFIRHWWQRGYAAESRLVALENWIEHRRVDIFVDFSVTSDFDWKTDWVNAKTFHDYQRDQVQHVRTHLDGVKQLWAQWSENTTTHFSNISLEALRSILLINGAAIIAALAVLTGQIDMPRSSAIISAKITTITSVISMIMVSTGHAILWDRISYMLGKVRNAVIGTPRHRRVYSVSRYLRRHLDPVTRISNALIYGSIVVFAASALLCAFILAFG